MKFDLDELAGKSLPELIDIALKTDEGPKFWFVAGVIAGQTRALIELSDRILAAGRSWNYAGTYRAISELKTHESD